MGDGGVMAVGVVKIEKSCVENKQPAAASSLCMSEGSCGWSGMSPSVCSSSRSSPFDRRASGPIRRAKGGWTAQEDETLRRAVEAYKGRCWKKIADFFPNRTEVQCLHRWQKVLNPELIKGPWTQEEDDHIISLVGKYGPSKWSTIAKSLPGRIGKQCRERWHNHLDPTIRKDAWTSDEELALMNAHHMYGNKWAEIAKVLPGRMRFGAKRNFYEEQKVEQPGKTLASQARPRHRHGLPRHGCASDAVEAQVQTVFPKLGYVTYMKKTKARPYLPNTAMC